MTEKKKSRKHHHANKSNRHTTSGKSAQGPSWKKKRHKKDYGEGKRKCEGTAKNARRGT